MATHAAGNKIFHDPIHGSMEFESVLVKIIDTPEFQRLRRIKQLGAGCYVYPGATHTRFEHSLGVCYLAGKFADHLKKVIEEDEILKNEIEITPDEILCIKIAGLCHDLGHGPFSHMFEVFAHKAVATKKWEHEEMSVKVLEKILSDVDDPTLCEKKDKIAALIRGSTKTGKKHFLYQIVANKDTGIDVDKWDYFARDCHYLGLSNDFQWMRCMMLAQVKKIGGTDDYQICYRDSDVANIYAMFRTRSTLHQKAYQHIRVKAVEHMMIDCLFHMKDSLIHGLQKTLQAIINDEDVAEFVKLDDSIVESLQESVNAPAFELIQRLRKRKLYRYMGFAKMKQEKSLKEEDIEKELGECFAISVVKVKFGSEKDNPLGKLWFYSKDGQPFEISPKKSEQISLGGLLLPREYQPQHEVRFYCKNTEAYDIEIIRGFLETHSVSFGKLEPTLTQEYFSMTDGK